MAAKPSLWPKPNFLRFLNRIREMNRAGYRLSVSMQTNGFRYDPALFEILAEFDVSVGVSLDGPREYNDRRRVTHRGTGSYDRIMANVEKIPSWYHRQSTTGISRGRRSEHFAGYIR